jgi:hypothetical protein
MSSDARLIARMAGGDQSYAAFKPFHDAFMARVYMECNAHLRQPYW